MLVKSAEVIAVKPGTKIKRGGEELVVTEEEAVQAGDRLYVTPRQLAAIKEHPSITVESAEEGGEA